MACRLQAIDARITNSLFDFHTARREIEQTALRDKRDVVPQGELSHRHVLLALGEDVDAVVLGACVVLSVDGVKTVRVDGVEGGFGAARAPAWPRSMMSDSILRERACCLSFFSNFLSFGACFGSCVVFHST